MRPIEPLVRLPHSHIDPNWLSTVERASSRPHSQRNRIAPGKSASDRYLPLSDVFQSEIVVHGMAEFLLAAEIPFGCLHRCVAKEKLNLLKLSACEMA